MIFFFFNDTATTEIYTLSLHDALPISPKSVLDAAPPKACRRTWPCATSATASARRRSEEHTSELQSLAYLVCRLLLEKKKKQEELIILTGEPRSSGDRDVSVAIPL